MAFRLTKSISLGSAYAGLTLKAQLVNADGTNNGSAVTTGFSERGLGMYLWDYAAYPDGFRGIVEIRNNADNTLLAVDEVNPEEVFIAGSTLSAADKESIADTMLGRNVAGGSNTGRTVKEALYALRNKRTRVGTTMTVYGIDDATVAWTATIGAEAVNPATSVDPG